MSINVTNLQEKNNILTFTISNINVCYANSIRRIILSHIPCVVFKCNHEDNKLDIIKNTSRFNNEIIKQRLGCIPIFMNAFDNELNIDDYIVELDVTNTTNNIIYVTSKEFKIKNVKNEKYLSDDVMYKIFPPDIISGDYIDIIRLRPLLGEKTGESIKLTAKLSIDKAVNDGMYNVVSTCSYGNTVDPIAADEEWKNREQNLKSYSNKEIQKIKKDFYVLNAKRFYKKNSFDYIIETLGIYNNFEIVKYACSILIDKLLKFDERFKSNDDYIKESEILSENSYDLILENEDYTIGKIIEYNLYKKYFDKEIITYIGFLKKHPHDDYSIIRVVFKDIIKNQEIINLVSESINDAILMINEIKDKFKE
tara:strand:+ start:5887 stop:6987 length:1101 start_codon:yes stop_codon:yes gene_type:complete